MEQIFPHIPPKEPILLKPGFQTSRLPNCETMDVCCLSHLVCGVLLGTLRKLTNLLYIWQHSLL